MNRYAVRRPHGYDYSFKFLQGAIFKYWDDHHKLPSKILATRCLLKPLMASVYGRKDNGGMRFMGIEVDEMEYSELHHHLTIVLED